MDKKKELDRVFSLYIRLRDARDDGMIRCISCGRLLPFSTFDCGHYFGRMHTATRWNEKNCNAECVTCNRHDTGHLDGYKENLVAKIGLRAFDEIERLHNTIKEEPTEEEYDVMIESYKRKCRQLSREKGIHVSI